MKNKAFKFALQLAGFTIVSLLTFVWYMGFVKNNSSLTLNEQDQQKGSEIHRGLDGKKNHSLTTDIQNDFLTITSNEYEGPTFSKPTPVANKSYGYGGGTAGEPIATKVAPDESEASAVTDLAAIRNWRGVHRDAIFSKSAYERFGSLVTELSREHGLYPDVFLSRIIAYSYDYVSDPKMDPFDNNFTAMKAPNGNTRARFKNSFESLKAYAVVNAGEITQLSPEGAIAKHERAWTMRKIIDTYSYIKAMGTKFNEDGISYSGQIGTANKVSDEKMHEREVVGEAIKMTAKVDEGIKHKKASGAGFKNWDEYLENLPEATKKEEERKTAEVVSAVSKKKAININRRVSAKKQKQEKS